MIKICIILIIILQQYIKNCQIKDNNILIQRFLTEADSEKNKKRICDLLEGEIEDGKVVSKEQQESWYYNQQTLQKTRDINYLDDYVKGNDGAINDFLIHLAKQIGVFLVFFIFSIFGCLGYWICCICDCICPPCKLCMKKRDRLYSGIELHWPLLGNAVFLSWVFIICIYGLSYSNALENSFNTFICAALTAFDGLAYGGGNFSGINGIKVSLADFSENQLSIIQTNTAATFTGEPEWVSLEKVEMDYISQQMKQLCTGGDCVECTGQTYTNTQPQLVIDNSPVCAANSWIPYVSSYDYSSPNQQSNFFSDAIWQTQVDASITLYEGAVVGITSAIQGIEASGQNINDQQATMKDAIDSGVTSMGSLLETITKQMDTVTGYHDDFSTYMSLVSTGVLYQLIAFLIFSLFAAVVLIIIHFKKWFKMRIFLHLCWIIFSLLMLITFLITVILLGIAFGGEQLCDITFKMFNDPIQFDLYSGKLPQDLTEKIVICKKELNLVTTKYKGDDNLAKAFGIESQLESISNIKQSILTFEQEAGLTSENMINLLSVPGELDTIITNLDTLRATFKFEGVLDAPNLQAELNSIETDLTGCGITDIYVPDKNIDCGATTYQNFNPDPGAGPFCFHVEDDYVNNRFAACPAAEASISIVENWRNHKNNVVDLKKIQTQDLKEQLQLFISLHQDYIQAVTDYNNQVITALDVIAGDNGILNSIKCFWFGQQIDNFNDALCISFINSCYNIGFIYGFFSIGIFFSSFFLYNFAMKMSFNAKHINKVQQFEPIEQKLDKEKQAENIQNEQNLSVQDVE